MTNLTLTERRERIAEDDGDPDTTVHYPRSGRWGTPVYHDDAECKQITGAAAERMTEETRGRMQRRDRAPCKVCVLDGGGQPDTLEWECPFCSTDVGQPAAHLPCDGSEGAAEVDGV